MLKKILLAPSVQIALLGVIILIGMLSSLNPWEHLETRHYDFWAHHFRSPQDQPVVIVAIDEKSIRELGQWPWPRSRIAEMVRLLTAQGAGAMGIWPLYTQPDPDPGLQEIEEAKKQVGDRNWSGGRKAARIVQGMLSKAEDRLDQDAQLMEAVRRARNVVLPIRFTKGRQAATESDRMSGMLVLNSLSPEVLASGAAETPRAEAGTLNGGPPKRLISVTGVWETYEDLATKASGLGHLNLDEDEDGLFRRMPLLIEYKERLFPAMSLQLAIRHLGGRLKDLTVGRNFFGQPCLRIKHLEIATDDAYRILMNYDGGWTRKRTYSFVDVLQGSLDPAIFRNNIVLIGVTGEGMAPFYRIGPYDKASSVEITANTLARILSTVRLSRPSWARALEIVALVYFAFFLMFVIPRVNVRVGAAMLGIFLVTWYLLGVVLLLGSGYWIKPFGPALLACVGFVWTAAQGYGRKLWREVLDANKTLGLHYQAQGQLDLAFDRFIKCPLQNETVKHLMYNLGLDFERKRMFEKASMIYRLIGKYGPFRDIEKRSSRLETPDGTMALPVAGGVEKPLLMDDSDIKPIFGRYEVLRELGRGSMGTVYLGRDPKINREVAIKTLKYADVGPGDLDQVKTRFFREAEAAGKLSHPNIVSIYDVGEEHDMAYIAMELLNGRDLTRFCVPGHLLPVHQVLSIIGDVATALDYAHGQGVIHRDIKPANIMLLEDGRVKVTDFGIALVVDSSKTRTGTVLGTPNYMSPEQVAGQTLDGRSDLFSLGIVLYELLAGAKPFKGDTISAIIHAVTHNAHQPLSEVEQEIPACCQAIVDRLLAKGPNDRFDSAARLSEAIEACAADLPGSTAEPIVDAGQPEDPGPEPAG